MKRKLACFLAAVMTITAMPVNTFAWGNGNGRQAQVRLANSPIVVNSDGRQVEIGAVGPVRRAGDPAPVNDRMTEDDLFMHNDWFPANDLIVVFDETQAYASPMQFVLELENAEWLRDNSAVDLSRGRWDGRVYTRYVDPLMFFLVDEDDFITYNGPNGYTATSDSDPGLDWSEVLQDLAGIDADGEDAPGQTRYINIGGSAADRLAKINDIILALNEYTGDIEATEGLKLYEVLRNFDFGAYAEYAAPLYTLEVSAGNGSRAVVTIQNGFDFTDFKDPGRQDSIPRSALNYDPQPITVAPEAPSTGDVAVQAPEVVETFGKKKQEEQAPEGAPESPEVQPARTTEAVLVDAMDEIEYQALTSDKDSYDASVKKLQDAKANLDAVIADIAAGKVAADAKNFEAARPDIQLGIQVINAVENAILGQEQTVNGHTIPATPSKFQIETFLKDNWVSLEGTSPANNTLAKIAATLSKESNGAFNIVAPGLESGNRNERIQFNLTSANNAAQAGLEQLESFDDETLLDGTHTPPTAVGIILNNLGVMRTRLETILRLITNNYYTNKDSVQISRGAGIRIPLVVSGTGGNVDRTVQVVDSTFPISTAAITFSRSGAAGRTVATIADVNTGRDRIQLQPITVSETRPRVFPVEAPLFQNEKYPTDGVFELVAPSGFRFVSVDGVGITAEGGIRALEPRANGTAQIVPGNEGRVLSIGYRSIDREMSTTLSNGQHRINGSLVITGLVIAANNPDTVSERELELEIRDIPHSGTNIVEEQSLLVARTADFGIRLSVRGDVPTLVSGQLDSTSDRDITDGTHRAADIRIEEVVRNSLAEARDIILTLPEQVRVRKLQLRELSGLSNSGFHQFYFNDHGHSRITDYAREYGNDENIRITDNVVRIRNLARNNTSATRFDVRLWLNIEAGYEGPIDLTLSGSALASNLDQETVTIAEAINPVTINADLNRVRMGYTFQPVADFSITENKAGILGLGKDLYVSVTDEFLSEIHIGANFTAAVTEGDLGIRNVRSSNNLGIFNNWNNNLNWRLGSNIIVEIDRESTQPSTITFSNVQLRLSPTSPLPSGVHNYSIVAWGPAIAQNFEGLRETGNNAINNHEFFNSPGVAQVFVQAQGQGVSGTLSNVAEVTVGTQVVLVNGQQMGMDTEAYINETSESLMVPVRFVAMALGLEPGRVMWDTSRATVTIDAGERIVQFVIGQDVMRVNGVEIPMLNALGSPVKAEIKDGRTFIPFRALADALDVFVSWNPETATATFDATRPAERNFHLEDIVGAGATTLEGEVTTAKVVSKVAA